MKIFRKVRFLFISKNKFSKYLLYAIGEIILVVIGILIALAINNSNQDRVTREKEQTYLNGLRDEFQTSKLKLETLISVNKGNYNGTRQIMMYLSDPDENPTEKQFSELLLNAFSSDISFNPNNSLLMEMMNSGSIKDISNDTLRIQLTNWMATLEDINRQEYALENQREKVQSMFNTDEYSIKTILSLTTSRPDFSFGGKEENISNLPLLESVAFENNILLFMLTSLSTEESHYTPLMKDLNSILALIEREIK